MILGQLAEQKTQHPFETVDLVPRRSGICWSSCGQEEVPTKKIRLEKTRQKMLTKSFTGADWLVDFCLALVICWVFLACEKVEVFV